MGHESNVQHLQCMLKEEHVICINVSQYSQANQIRTSHESPFLSPLQSDKTGCYLGRRTLLPPRLRQWREDHLFAQHLAWLNLRRISNLLCPKFIARGQCAWLLFCGSWFQSRPRQQTHSSISGWSINGYLRKLGKVQWYSGCYSVPMSRGYGLPLTTGSLADVTEISTEPTRCYSVYPQF